MGRWSSYLGLGILHPPYLLYPCSRSSNLVWHPGRVSISEPRRYRCASVAHPLQGLQFVVGVHAQHELPVDAVVGHEGAQAFGGKLQPRAIGQGHHHSTHQALIMGQVALGGNGDSEMVFAHGHSIGIYVSGTNRQRQGSALRPRAIPHYGHSRPEDCSCNFMFASPLCGVTRSAFNIAIRKWSSCMMPGHSPSKPLCYSDFVPIPLHIQNALP